MDCDCKQCLTRFRRLWAWLESDPGPWLSIFPWALLAIVGLCYLARS